MGSSSRGCVLLELSRCGWRAYQSDGLCGGLKLPSFESLKLDEQVPRVRQERQQHLSGLLHRFEWLLLPNRNLSTMYHHASQTFA
jgi:hypothetical protein